MAQQVEVYLAVGGNIDPETSIPEALRRLSENVTITAISTFYETEAISRPRQPNYLNGVAAVACAYPLRALKFDVLRGIEQALGRTRNEDRYAARPIDLDILLYGDIVTNEPDMILPAPELRERAFLAVALHEVAPELVLPDTGEALADIVDRIRDVPLLPAREFTQRLKGWLGR